MNNTCCVIRPKKDRGSKYPLEAFHDAAITLAVFEEMEKVEDFGTRTKSDNPTSLADRHRGYPDWDEAILTVRETVPWMAGDLEKEPSITPCVGQLIGGGTSEEETAKDKGPGMVSEFLVSVVTFLSDNSNCFEMAKSELGDAQGWQGGPSGRKKRTAACAGPRRPAPRVRTAGVPKVFQKSKELGLKGLLIERKQIPGIGVSDWRIWYGIE